MQMSNNDPCLDCKTPTLGIMTMADGSTVGIGINRLSYDDGWRCGECAGYQCDACGKQIYLDTELIIETEDYGNEFYHSECLTPEIIKKLKPQPHQLLGQENADAL